MVAHSPLGPAPSRHRPHPIAVVGRNCWRREHADRVAVLVDGQDYFVALKRTLLRARRSILLLGWDIDSRTRLDRCGSHGGAPNTLGELLRHVVERRPELRVQVLIWDTALIYSWNREFWSALKLRAGDRLDFRLDDSHPLGASHHQKIVVVDDSVAFVGGMDVSSGRWDSRCHAPGDNRRSDAVTPRYPPFHDVMLMVSGDAAAALGEIARQRWRCATGQRLRPVPRNPDAWPPQVVPLMRHVTAAIARTLPPWEGGEAVREVERLYLDMVGAAHRFLFFENQFFASRVVGRALLTRLTEPDPPDILIVSSQEPLALLERAAMGVGRARLYGRLSAADRLGRVRLYYPEVDGIDVKIHSKVTIVDDRMLRIGSANLNNRSMGLDTECDVLIEALGDPAVEQAIAGLRRDLLAEHLGTTPEAVAQAERRHGRLVPAVEALCGGRRTLIAMNRDMLEQWADATADIFDPDGPVEPILAVGAKATWRRRRAEDAAPAAALVLLAVAAAMAPFLVPDGGGGALAVIEVLRAAPWGPAAMVAAFLAGGLVAVPVTVLLMLAGVAFGLFKGLAVGLAGATASGIATFLLGRWLGRDRVRRLAGRRMNRVIRAMPRRGIHVIVMLRLLPVASYTVVNLVAGAARTRPLDFLLGSLLGMAPVAAALVLFGDRVAAVLRDPSSFNIGVLAALTAALVGMERSLAHRMARGAASSGDVAR